MKAWKNIEKRYKIIFYIAIAVFYILTIGNIYRVGYNLQMIPIYSTFFIIAILAYFSRSKFEGALLGLAIWVPLFVYIYLNFTKIFPYIALTGTNALGIFIIYSFFTILGAIVGTVFGFIGSKRREDTSGGNSEVLNEHRLNSEVEV